MQQLSAEWGKDINERCLRHGFDWKTQEFRPELENSPLERYVRDRDVGMAKDALLTESRAQLLFRDIIIPNDHNRPNEPYEYKWRALGADTDRTMFPTPKGVLRCWIKYKDETSSRERAASESAEQERGLHSQSNSPARYPSRSSRQQRGAAGLDYQTDSGSDHSEDSQCQNSDNNSENEEQNWTRSDGCNEDSEDSSD